MSPEQFLMMIMVEAGMKINPGTLDSLKEAIQEGNIYFFENLEGEPVGFVTWFLDSDTLEVNNLCLYGEHKDIKLYELREMLHNKYPNIKSVRWLNDKRQKPFEVHFERI